jgi:hypothetical protein
MPTALTKSILNFASIATFPITFADRGAIPTQPVLGKSLAAHAQQLNDLRHENTP